MTPRTRLSIALSAITLAAAVHATAHDIPDIPPPQVSPGWYTAVNAQWSGARLYTHGIKSAYYGRLVCFGDGAVYPPDMVLIEKPKGYIVLSVLRSPVVTEMWVSASDPALKRADHGLCTEYPQIDSIMLGAQNLYLLGVAK